MYVLTVAFRDGRCVYFGPFPTEERAEEYALACQCTVGYARHTVSTLTVPFNVVQRVIWKESTDAA